MDAVSMGSILFLLLVRGEWEFKEFREVREVREFREFSEMEPKAP